MSLYPLLKQRYDLKSNIDYLQSLLSDIDEQLVELIESPEEGTTSASVNDLKIIVTGRVTRTVNAELLQESFNNNDLPQDVAKSCFKWKPSLDLKSYRVSIKNQPTKTIELLKSIVTEKTSKPSITIEKLNHEQPIINNSQYQST